MEKFLHFKQILKLQVTHDRVFRRQLGNVTFPTKDQFVLPLSLINKCHAKFFHSVLAAGFESSSLFLLESFILRCLLLVITNRANSLHYQLLDILPFHCIIALLSIESFLEFPFGCHNFPWLRRQVCLARRRRSNGPCSLCAPFLCLVTLYFFVSYFFILSDG